MKYFTEETFRRFKCVLVLCGETHARTRATTIKHFGNVCVHRQRNQEIVEKTMPICTRTRINYNARTRTSTTWHC